MSLPKPGRADPAVRHLADDRDVVVDPYAAGVDLARRALRPVHITRPGRSRQTERGVVGLPQRVVVVGERPHRQHRAEDLVAVDLGGLGDVGDQRGPVEGPGQSGALPPVTMRPP